MNPSTTPTPESHPTCGADALRRRRTWLGLSLWAASIVLVTSTVASAAEGNQLALWGTFTLVDETPRVLGQSRHSGELLLDNVRSLTRSSSPLYVVRTDGRITSWMPRGYGGDKDLPPLPGVVSVVHASSLEHLGRLAALLADGRVAIYELEEWRFLPELTEVVALTYGAGHLVALRADGAAMFIGPSTGDRPTVVMHRVTQVAGGASSTANSIAGLVYGDGEVAIFGGDESLRTNAPPGLRGVKELAMGGYLVAALTVDGSVAAWGIPEAAPPPAIRDVVSVAAGDRHVLARTADGRVIAWGDNAEGQADVPLGLSNVVAVAAGRVHSVALRADGSVVAWGGNREGQTAVPPELRDVTHVAAWGNQTLVIDIRRPPVLASQPTALRIPRFQNAHLTVTALGFGLHYEWFRNGESVGPPSIQPGLDFPGNVSIPGPGTYTVRVTNTAGAVTSQPVRVDLVEPLAGTVVAWSHRDHGTSRQALIPPGLSNVVAIASGGDHVVALTAGGQVISWGGGESGESNVPEGLNDVIAIAAAERRSMALRADGVVVEWGATATRGSYRPAGMEHPMAIAVSSSHALALDADGRVVSWGEFWLPNQRPPVELRDAIGIVALGASSVVLFQDGSVQSWGPMYNPCSAAPMPVGLADIRSIQAGRRTVIALGNQGGIHVWGYVCGGVATPPNIRGIFSAAIAHDIGAALMEDGGLVTWGDSWLHHRPSFDVSWAIAADSHTLYEIVGPPVAAPLRVQQTPSATALIWWPFTRREVLEFTERLDAPQWRAVPDEARRYNELRRLEIPPDAASGYYRLVSP